jgi:hypothetical protein
MLPGLSVKNEKKKFLKNEKNKKSKKRIPQLKTQTHSLQLTAYSLQPSCQLPAANCWLKTSACHRVAI